MTFASEIKQFTKYCNEFYNIKTGIHPIATKKQIDEAVRLYILRAKKYDVQFDSIDRQLVRAIIEPKYQVI